MGGYGTKKSTAIMRCLGCWMTFACVMEFCSANGSHLRDGALHHVMPRPQHSYSCSTQPMSAGSWAMQMPSADSHPTSHPTTSHHRLWTCFHPAATMIPGCLNPQYPNPMGFALLLMGYLYGSVMCLTQRKQKNNGSDRHPFSGCSNGKVRKRRCHVSFVGETSSHLQPTP